MWYGWLIGLELHLSYHIWFRSVFLYIRILYHNIKTSFWVQSHPLNLFSRVVNSHTLFCFLKAGVKCSYYGIQKKFYDDLWSCIENIMILILMLNCNSYCKNKSLSTLVFLWRIISIKSYFVFVIPMAHVHDIIINAITNNLFSIDFFEKFY